MEYRFAKWAAMAVRCHAGGGRISPGVRAGSIARES
jgi:hypothetical protein